MTEMPYYVRVPYDLYGQGLPDSYIRIFVQFKYAIRWRQLSSLDCAQASRSAQ